MFEKCLTCPKFGTSSCNMTKLFSLPANELLKLCKQQKKKLHLSNADVAEGSGIPKGTVDRLFAEDDYVDFKYETIRRIVIYLFGGGSDEELCFNPAAEASASEKVKHYEEEIKNLQHQLDVKDQQIASCSKLIETRGRFMKQKDFAIGTLSFLLFICVAVIIAALVIDRLNSDIGFFWLEKMSTMFTTADYNTTIKNMIEWRI